MFQLAHQPSLTSLALPPAKTDITPSPNQSKIALDLRLHITHQTIMREISHNLLIVNIKTMYTKLSKNKLPKYKMNYNY